MVGTEHVCEVLQLVQSMYVMSDGWYRVSM